MRYTIVLTAIFLFLLPSCVFIKIVDSTSVRIIIDDADTPDIQTSIPLPK